MAAVAASHWQALATSGWAIKDEGKTALAEQLQGNAPLAEVQNVVLNSDLRKVGASVLPEDINRVAQSSLQGPLVVQIVSVVDISQPSRVSAESGSSSGRLLRLKVTDGKLTATCIEFRSIGHLKDAIAPGTKLLLKGKLQIRNGLVLLEPKNVEVVGGRVESLAEAWEVQQKYGGLDKLRPQGAEASETPPPFKHFNLDRKSKAPTSPAAFPCPPEQKDRRSEKQAAGMAASGFPPGLTISQGSSQAAKTRGRHGGRGSGLRSAGPSSDYPAGAVGGQHEEPRRPSGRGARGRGGRVSQGLVGHVAPTDPPVGHEGSHRNAPVARELHAAGSRACEAEEQQSSGQPQQHSRLQGKLAAGEQQRREELEKSRQRRQKARMRRRGLEEEDGADGGSMTLEEWEARQRTRLPAPKASPAYAEHSSVRCSQMDEDERLARELQRQMELEASGLPPARDGPVDLADDLKNSLFSFDRTQDDSGHSGGRGRRGRGGGGRGRGRGRGRR